MCGPPDRAGKHKASGAEHLGQHEEGARNGRAEAVQMEYEAKEVPGPECLCL